MRSRHRRLSRSLASLRRPIHLAAALALVLTLGWLPAGLAAPAPAALQDGEFPGVDGTFYESPSWGYTLEWDGAVWEVQAARSNDGRDQLILVRPDGAGRLLVDGYDGFNLDPVSCIAGALAKIENRTGVADIAPYENPDGEVVAGEEEDRAFAAYRFTVEREGGPEEQVQYNECRTIVPGEAVVEITHLAPADVYEAEAALVADVLATLTIPSAETDEEATEEPAATPDGATPEASPEETDEAADDATPTAEPTEEAEETVEIEATVEVEDAEATEAPTENATEEASDEATEEPDDEVATEAATEESGEEATEAATEEPEEEATEEAEEDATEQPEDEEATEEPEDEDATEEATEEPEDEDATEEATEEPEEESLSEDDLEDAGVDGDTYTSPTFEYTLEWDEDDWEAVVATSEDDVDTLVLASDASTLTIVGVEDFDGDPADCLDELVADLEDGPDVEEFAPGLDSDGDPIEIEEDDRVGAVYTATVDGEDLVYRVECRVLVEDEAVIQIVQEVPRDDYPDEIGLVADVLDTLTLEGEEPADEDADDDEDIDEIPVPDDEGDPADEDADDDTGENGVDGNAYTSPSFGYTLEWDEDDWAVDSDSTRSVPGDDFLVLDGRRGGLTIWGLEQFGGDPLVCFSTFVDILGEDTEAATVEDVEPFEDEDGNVVEGEEDDRVFGAFLFTFEDVENGGEFELVYYVECRTLVEDESVLIIIHGLEPLAYESEAQRREDVLGTLDVPGVGADDEDTEDDEESEDEDEDEDEQTPDGGGRSPDDDEEDAEDADEDDGRDTADDPDDRNLQTYTSDRFGYTVAWDRGVWSLVSRDVDDDRDVIEINGEAGLLSFAGQNRFAGDPDDCLNTAITNLRARDGVEDWRRVEDASLLPDGRGGRDSAVAMFSFTLAPDGRTPTEYYAYVDCRVVVPGESVLAIVYTVPADDYEAERDALGTVLAAIDLPGE